MLTILVIDGNDDRMVFDQTFSVQENSPQNTLVGTINVEAPPGTRQFTLTSGNINNAFTLHPVTGELTVNNPSELNYENRNTYTLTTISTINGRAFTPTLTIHIKDANDPPAISHIPDQRTDENITSSAIPFQIYDPESDPDNLTLSAHSSNSALVPENQIVFGGSGENRFVTITPGNNQSGIVMITLTVRDQIISSSISFTLVVNDAPDITDIGDITIAEDQSTGFIPFEIFDSESDYSELTIVVFSSDQNLVTDQNIQVNCSHIGCTLSIMPNPDQSGTALITIRVSDGHIASEDSFLLTVEPANDPPLIEIGLEAGTPVIAAGAYHSLASSRNTVMAWGKNDMGQLGTGTSGVDNGKPYPNSVNGLENIVDLAAGENFSLALSDNGTVWSWGDNSYGQLGIGSDSSKIDSPQRVLLLTDIMDIDAGYAHALALQENGTVWSWGNNSKGQLGNGKTGQDTSENKPVLIPTLDNCVAIAAGYGHSVALKNDGTVWTWGFNASGQLGDRSETDKTQPVIVPGLANIIAIAAGDYHTVALKSDGTVWAWGDNPFGQLGDGSTIMKNCPVRVLDIFNVTGIAAGYVHTLAIRNDGTVWAWGSNVYGQLGDNSDLEMQARPVKADIFPHVIDVKAGHYHSLVLKSDGSVWSFGGNGFGQLGDNTLQGNALPLYVNGPDNIGKLDIGIPLTIDEDNQTDPILFSITDEETPSADLVVSVTSSNSRLINNSGIIIEGSGKNQSLIIQPFNNQYGRTTITIKVSDGLSFSTESFTLWVNEINDAPMISDIGYQAIDEDTSSPHIPFSISDIETPADQLLVSATSSNTELIPNASIQISGSGQARTVLLTPSKDMYGIATITIDVSDGVFVVSDTFTVRVKNVNDVPVISQISDKVTDEDTPSQSIEFVISDLETPVADLIVSANSSDPSKISLITFDGDREYRSLSILPGQDQFGTVQITIEVSDGELSAHESFALYISPVDDAPIISSIPDQEFTENMSISIPFSVTDTETPANDLIFAAISSDTSIVSNDNITIGGSDNARTINIEPTEDQSGTTDITIAVSDGNNTEFVTFSLTLTPELDWNIVENINITFDLKDIWGRAADDIFAVGNGGIIYHYNGISWSKRVTVFNDDFNAVWGNDDMVYVVGNNGVILQYNGYSWEKMFTSNSEHLNGIWGNGRSVFAVGSYGTILKYNGINWAEINSGTTTTLLDIWGNENKMYAVGNGGMVLQYDGYEWRAMSKITAYSLRKIWGSSENNVFAVGDGGTIIHFNGTEWVEQERGNFSSFKGIWGLSSDKVFAAGLQGTIVSYNGNMWSETVSGVSNTLIGIWGESIKDIYVVGENGTILKYVTDQTMIEERNALMSLYNSTNGDHWTDKTKWNGDKGTECSWYGVTCSDNHITHINLNNNQLTGQLPPQIYGLGWLKELHLSSNKLNGAIPEEVSQLTHLELLDLSHNDFSGELPTALFNIESLHSLYLSRNHFSGHIPDNIGNLSNLLYMDLSSNKLAGDIPSDILNLIQLYTDQSDIRYNALYANNSDVTNFLNDLWSSYEWQQYQTIAPSNIRPDWIETDRIQIIWDTIPDIADGGYELWYSTSENGPYTLATTTKSILDYTGNVHRLDSDTLYYFKMRTFTLSHTDNQNRVESDFSPLLSARTEKVNNPQVITSIVNIDCLEDQVAGPIPVTISDAEGGFYTVAVQTSDLLSVAENFLTICEDNNCQAMSDLGLTLSVQAQKNISTVCQTPAKCLW
ncbi:MAG: hypothetical protein OMM_02282 [Candidatus Magnetoglobus multicellularis str. Araruama]|uniref:Cadherin domain-containing protein n=1 Tax=Candidatus Magnetoglobus multicellularis str. Araruama TaxID=890399 RepID=A0A1V1PAB0_9BACT|nr:MAG: hypothetical protein OMM_02282 [Candidatus Magnetoglobus multicellularis str. Araruama]